MALFKINKGKSDKLPSTYKEGYCYLTTDDGKFYIDTSNTADGRIVLNPDAITNIQINSQALKYTKNNGTTVNLTYLVGKRSGNPNLCAEIFNNYT